MDNFFRLLANGKTQFHVTNELKQLLTANGFSQLDIDSDWELSSGGRYFVSPYSSMLVAFVCGTSPDGFRLAACHTDFPMLKLKPNPVTGKLGYVQMNVEPYGGLIKSSWFDRPLGLAGKVVCKSDDVFKPKVLYLDSNKPLFIIPSLAPHLDRDKKSGDIDAQKELMPVTAMSENFSINEYISEALEIDEAAILDYELYLYVYGQPAYVGLKDEFISSPRIDNISSVSAIADALCSADNCKQTIIGAFFDNEEIGSRSKQGADSILLKDIIEKINKKGSYKNSFALSVDVAHATHPNYTEKYDITNNVILGEGVVLKHSASQRYVTDCEAGAILTDICRRNNIKLQRQVNRSGMPGGQTLGPIIASYLPVKAVDIGIPVLAMHSAVETAHTEDYTQLCALLRAFFNA